MEKKTFKEIRKEKGISVAHIAKSLNKSRQTIYNKEAGTSEWNGLEVQKLCDLYGIDISAVKL